jgi:hypothetical protein
LFPEGDKMKKILVSLIGVSVLFWMDCSDKVKDGYKPTYVKGIVIDSLTKVPIDSAWIDKDILSPYWTYSDTSGKFQVFVGAPGRYRFLYCGKQDYVIKKKEYETVSNPVATVNFELVPLEK